jgi:hypothetical protein
MLSRHEFNDVPHRFEPKAQAKGEDIICSNCSADVFNPDLHTRLVAASNKASFSLRYTRTTADLYRSILDNCSWCTSIGNALLSSVDLDKAVKRWNGSTSDTDSLSETSRENEPDDDELSIRPKSKADDDEESVTDHESTSSNGDPGGSRSTSLEMLNCSASLDTTIEFVKLNDSHEFNLVDVNVEVTNLDGEIESIQSMNGDDSVCLTFEVFSTGKST